MALLACVAGLIGAGGTAFAYRQVSQAQRAAEQQLRRFGDIAAQVAATLRATSSSATNAAASIEAAEATLATASRTTRTAAETIDETGTTVNIAIPGLGRPGHRPRPGHDRGTRERSRRGGAAAVAHSPD